MTVDLDTDKQDYPQPSDLSTFVNETKFSSPTEGKLINDHSAAVNVFFIKEKNKSSEETEREWKHSYFWLQIG